MIQYPNLKFKHIVRNVKQHFVKNDVAIIGSYHGGNVGDMILGNTLKEILKSYNISSDLQTLHNLEKWPKREYAIIGGGAVGYNSALEKVYDNYIDHSQNIAIIGVDFNEVNLSEKSRKLLESVKFISCRSQTQQIKLLKQLKRKDIYVQPDIAFAYPIKRKVSVIKSPILLVNAIPLYGYFYQGKLYPEVQFKEERPEIFNNFERIHNSYRAFLIETIKHYQNLGFRVESLPFSTEDDIYCKKFLNNLNVKINSYTSCQDDVINLMKNADTVLCTRYHATIFSLRLNKKIIPLAYAKKNEELLNSIGMENFLTTSDFLNTRKNYRELPYDQKVIEKWESEAKEMIENGLSFITKSLN